MAIGRVEVEWRGTSGLLGWNFDNPNSSWPVPYMYLVNTVFSYIYIYTYVLKARFFFPTSHSKILFKIGKGGGDNHYLYLWFFIKGNRHLWKLWTFMLALSSMVFVSSDAWGLGNYPLPDISPKRLSSSYSFCIIISLQFSWLSMTCFVELTISNILG